MSNGLKLPPLGALPIAWRIVLTVFATIIAGGYIAALSNVLAQNELTDGKPGLTPYDLRLKYAGAWVTIEAGEAPPSLMLTQIQTSMRQYFSDDTEYESMFNWLSAGAPREAFESGPEPTPSDVLLISCLRCHADDSDEEIARTASFGPSEFDPPDYDAVAEFVTVAEPGVERVWREPRDWRALALTTHAHMLSVPMFVLALAGLFLWAVADRARQVSIGIFAALPLAMFLVDVSCWWLARIEALGTLCIYTIMASGAVFGLAFVTQWAVVVLTLWRRPPAQA